MKNMIMLVFMLVYMNFCWSSEGQKSFRYSTIGDNNATFIINHKKFGSAAIVNDVLLGFSECHTKEEPVCYSGFFINFILPDRSIKINDEWKKRHITFKLLANKNIRILGVDRKDIMIIEAKRFGIDKGDLYFFSKEYGLLGFKLYEKNKKLLENNDESFYYTDVYWSETERGLGYNTYAEN